MKTIGVGTLLLAGVAMAVAAGDDKQPATPIPLAEIHERGVEGRLGVRLGTIVTVSGEVVPNTSGTKVFADVPFFLSILSVDSRELKEPVLYPFEARLGAKVELPQIEDLFTYVAYEAGRFDGSPDGEFEYVLPYASVGFSFETKLVVLAAK